MLEENTARLLGNRNLRKGQLTAEAQLRRAWEEALEASQKSDSDFRERRVISGRGRGWAG